MSMRTFDRTSYSSVRVCIESDFVEFGLRKMFNSQVGFSIYRNFIENQT